MAFSTFRGYFGAYGASAVVADTFSALIPAFPTDGTATWNSQEFNFCAGANSTEVYAVSLTSSTTYVWIGKANNSYISFGSRLALSTPSGGATVQYVDQIDANNFIVVYRNTTTTTVSAQVINNSSGTLSASVGETNVIVSGGAVATPIACVLDSSNALVFGFNSAANANNRLSLINPTTLASIQSNTNASGVVTTGTNASIVALSPTLAVIGFITSANVLSLASIDVVSGTSFTLRAAVASSVTSANGAFGIVKVNSSTLLIAYYKSANTLAVRTVTVASGGSITYNTEYTTTVTGLASSPQAISVAPYDSGKYVITYAKQFGTPGTNTGDGFESLGIQLTGNVVTFNSTASVLFKGAKFTNSFRQGQQMRALQLSTNNVMVSLSTAIATLGSCVNMTLIQASATASAPNWSTFDGTKNSTNQSVAMSAGTSGFCWLGFNRLIAQQGSANLRFMSFAAGVAGSGLVTTASSNVAFQSASNYALLAYDTTNAVDRILATYVSATNTVTTFVASNVSGTGVTANTSTTFTATGTSSGNDALIPIDANSAIYVYSDSANNINARRIDASGLTISSTNSDINIFNNGLRIQNSTSNFQYAVIDSTRILFLVHTSTAGSSPFGLYAFIATISGGTITGGTPVTIYNNYTNNPTSKGVTVFPSTSTGMILYAGDASTAQGIRGVGLTYSGSTITLGTPATLLGSFTNSSCYSGTNYSNRSLVSVSGNVAVYCYAQTGSGIEIVKVTYNNINSLTLNSSDRVTVGIQSASSQLFFDDTAQMVIVSRQISTTSTDTTFFYRA